MPPCLTFRMPDSRGFAGPSRIQSEPLLKARGSLAALEGHCDRLYSEDLQNGRRIGDLRIENPFV